MYHVDLWLSVVQRIYWSASTLFKLPDVYQQIPLYLHSLIHLEIPIIYPTELIPIFKSCPQLIYLNLTLNDDKNLKSLGGFIPKKLRRINFMLENKVDFRESLRCFLEEYHANNSASGLLKCLEFKHKHEFCDEYRLDSVHGIQIIEWHRDSVNW